MVEFKIKFEEIEKLKIVRPESYNTHNLDSIFFEPISIEIDGVIINADSDEFIKKQGIDIKEYPWGLYEDFVGMFLSLWLNQIPEILSGKPHEIPFCDNSDYLVMQRIDEKNIKMQFFPSIQLSASTKERNSYYQGAGKDFIIPIDIFLTELIRASKEWIDTRVVYAPKGKEDSDYIAITEAIEKAKQIYEQYKKKHNITTN